MRITKRRWTVATRAACILWFTGAFAEPYPAFGQFGPIQVVDVETVQFHRNGLELAGTIFIPRSTDASPGLVLVPAPRAEETAAYRRRVAEHFAGIGFTVLSYAPHRGRSISGDHPSAAVATALGAVEFLSAREGLQPERIGLVGFDDATRLLAHVATRQVPAFVVAVSPSGVGPGSGAASNIRNTPPPRRDATLPTVQGLALWQHVTTPVLVVFGGADATIDRSGLIDRWVTNLVNPMSLVVTVSGGGHWLTEGPRSAP
ncbi:MAG: hypothetical protein VYE68_08630 [Acidobacteriota bacterium]|nr:hypothetical protein [Acidobacteriota bacterium]